jgi:glycosyltransferase involved in cell wall biosynthesis
MYFAAMKKDYEYSHNYDLYVSNSQYTAKWLSKIWHIEENKTVIVNPAVSPMPQSIEVKSNLIFICSRIEKSKEIEVLIAAFLSNETIKRTFKLVIAGSVIDETKTYAEGLKTIIGNNTDSIILHENPSRTEIENYYCHAKFFWHAKGYSINEENDPYSLEHFGITTVEAMSAGCVPIVINKGGQKEIVDDGKTGFKWDTPDQLIEKTIYLSQHEDERQIMSKLAIESARNYSLENFTRDLGATLTGIRLYA